MSRIITFTTDWHNSDYYIGAVKAAIISKFRDIQFVDISHQIESFSVIQAAFVLKSVYKSFPDGTIHIVGVDSEPDKDGQILIAKYKSQYFICNNNGCTGLIFDDIPELCVLAETGFAFEGASFIELNVFADIASYICKDGDIREIGTLLEDVKRLPRLEPQIEPNIINGEVIFIDSYGNAITNISKTLFDEYVNTAKFEILLNTNMIKLSKIYLSYKQVEQGEMVCIFNSQGLLEIAVREGRADQLLSLKRKSAIRIRF